MAIAAHHPLTNSHAAARSAVPLSARVASWVENTLRSRRENAANWRALELMGERDLRDAGLSRWAIEQELSRPFWRG